METSRDNEQKTTVHRHQFDDSKSEINFHFKTLSLFSATKLFSRQLKTLA